MMKQFIIRISILFLLLQISCSKDALVVDKLVTPRFHINILGIDNDFNLDKIGSNSVKTASNLIHHEISKVTDDMEAAISIVEVPTFNTNIKNTKANKKIASIADTIARGSKFRVVFFGPYDSSSDIPTNGTVLTNYAGYLDGEFGRFDAENSLSLYRNKYYKYIVYSFNDSDGIAALNPDNFNITLPPNKEFLYAESFCQIPDEENSSISLSFTFKRKSVAFEIVVDARAMFGEIVGMGNTTFNGNIGTGKINLFTTQVTESSNATNPTQPFSKYESYNEELYNHRVKAVSFYTLANGPFPNTISISFTDPVITGDRRAKDGFSTDWGGDHEFKKTLTLTATNLSSTGRTLVAGKKYRIYATILMSGIKVENPSNNQDTMVWARGNLYERLRPVNGSLNNDPFKNQFMIRVHAGSNAYSSTTVSSGTRNINPIAGEFFAYPASFDPCAKVFPQGYWKLPTATEYDNLRSWMPTVNIDGDNYSNSSTTDRKNPYVVRQGGSPSATVPAIYMAKFFTASNNTALGKDHPYDDVKRITFLYQGRTLANSDKVEDYDAKGYYWVSTENSSTNANVYILGNNTFGNSTMETTRKANIKCIKNPSFSLKIWNTSTDPNAPNDIHRPRDRFGY